MSYQIHKSITFAIQYENHYVDIHTSYYGLTSGQLVDMWFFFRSSSSSCVALTAVMLVVTNIINRMIALWSKTKGTLQAKLIFCINKAVMVEQCNCLFIMQIRIRFHGWPSTQPALAHSRAPLLTQPCSHCSHSRAPGARLCVFTLHGCVQAARLCRGSPVDLSISE